MTSILSLLKRWRKLDVRSSISAIFKLCWFSLKLTWSEPQAKLCASSQAKGTNSTSFLTCVRNEVELVPLACEDELCESSGVCPSMS